MPRKHSALYRPAGNVPMLRQSANPHHRLEYVCLARGFATHPPIRHRGDKSDADLSLFEFVIAATCAGLARAKLAEARHQHALRAGREALQRERPQASRDMSFRMGRVSYQFMLAGKVGYEEGRRAFDHNADGESFLVEISSRALLRVAGLSWNSHNRARLGSALRRLTKPIAKFPPVLWRWPKAPNGHLRLLVDGWWVPRRRYARVPWPPPTSGPTVLALYVFLAGADLRGEASIQTETLYRRLGIPMSIPAHAQRALDRALALVNKQLDKLNKNGKLDELKLPTTFEIVPMAGGTKVHFHAGRGRQRNHDAADDGHDEARTDWDMDDDEAGLRRIEHQRETLRRAANEEFVRQVAANLGEN
jgi:hypothetical protein